MRWHTFKYPIYVQVKAHNECVECNVTSDSFSVPTKVKLINVAIMLNIIISTIFVGPTKIVIYSLHYFYRNFLNFSQLIENNVIVCFFNVWRYLSIFIGYTNSHQNSTIFSIGKILISHISQFMSEYTQIHWKHSFKK